MQKLLAFLGLTALSAAAWRYLGASKSSPGKMPTTEPTSATSKEDYSQVPAEAEKAKHVSAAAIMREGGKKALGRDLTDNELLIALGTAKYETSYGQGWTGACAGSNNWGSVHALPGQDGCEWTDSHADGKRYAQRMRRYPSPVDGAADVAKKVVKNSGVEAAVKGPNASLWRSSLSMRRNMYYGSWCKEAVKQYGAAAAKTSANRAPKTLGERACEREAVALHVWRMKKELATIAPSLGLPVIPEGTYEDAVTWFENGKKDSIT